MASENWIYVARIVGGYLKQYLGPYTGKMHDAESAQYEGDVYWCEGVLTCVSGWAGSQWDSRVESPNPPNQDHLHALAERVKVEQPKSMVGSEAFVVTPGLFRFEVAGAEPKHHPPILRPSQEVAFSTDYLAVLSDSIR